jgi:hypothetical protein
MSAALVAALSAIGILGLASAPPVAALTLTPGTILGGDAVSPGGTVFTLVQYSQTGTILDTLVLSNAASLGTMDGLTVIGSDVYVVGTSGVVGKVDLTTGAVSNFFNTNASAESLGDLNGNIMVGNYGGNSIDVYTPAGAFLNSITPAVNIGVTGLDSDGTNLYVGSYNDGSIYTLDLAGNVLNSFNSGVGGASISGLGYDSGSNTIWISTGFNQDDIRQYSLTGTLLGSFPANYPFIDGLDVVPIPEPGTLLLVGIGLTAALACRRR